MTLLIAVSNDGPGYRHSSVFGVKMLSTTRLGRPFCARNGAMAKLRACVLLQLCDGHRQGVSGGWIIHPMMDRSSSGTLAHIGWHPPQQVLLMRIPLPNFVATRTNLV